MGYNSVGGQWPPLRFSKEQMVSIRCAESHPRAPSLALTGNSPCRTLR